MSTQIKHRRGSAQEHLSFTGANSEITVDTDDYSLRVHDGVKVGGHKVAKQDSLDETNNNLATTNQDLLDLNDQTDQNFQQVNDDLTATQNDLDVVTNNTNTNTSEIASQDTRITSLEGTVGASRLSYETKALMDADNSQPDGTLAEVWNDTTTTNNGLYGRTGGAWVKSSYDLQTDLQGQIDDNRQSQYDDYKLYNVFRRYNQNDLTSLADPYVGNDSRGQIYRAIKNIRLGGNFDPSKPVKLRAVWNGYTASRNFRFILEEWDGATWQPAFDSENIDMTTIGLDPVDIFHYVDTKSGYSVDAEIDMALVTPGVGNILNNTIDEPELVFADNAFESLAVVTFDTVSVDNELLYNGVWSRYQEDIRTSLAGEYVTGYKRHLLYQAVKRLELYGFDDSQPIMLSHIWTNSYQPAQNLYRLIFKQWDGATWNTVFDVRGQKDDLGVVDGRIFTWDKIVGDKRIICDVDYTNIFVEGGYNNNPTLNPAEPDLVVAPNCFMKSTDPDAGGLTTEQRLLQHNGAKEYVLSRRKPTFAFVWDDLNETDQAVQDIFDEYGFQPTYALPTNRVSTATMPFYQGAYLKGASILAHSDNGTGMSDPNAITEQEVDDKMWQSKRDLEAYGVRVSGWVTPSSVLAPEFLPQAIKNFGYAFTTRNAGIFNETVDPVNMGRYGLEAAMSQAGGGITVVRARIDQAIANNELLVFYGHQLPSAYQNPDESSYMSVADFRLIMDYIKEKFDDNLCEVMNCDEAIRSYYKTPIR